MCQLFATLTNERLSDDIQGMPVFLDGKGKESSALNYKAMSLTKFFCSLDDLLKTVHRELQ